MPETTTEPTEQAQAVPEVQATTDTTATDQPSITMSDALDQLTTARMAGASESEIQRLEALVTSARTPAEAPVEEQVPVEPKEEQHPVATVEPVTPEAEEEPEEARVSKRVRIDHLPDNERALVQAANLLVKANKITFDQAWAQVNGRPSTPQIEQITEPEQPQTPPEITQLETEIADIESKLDAAAENGELFTKDIADLTRQQAKKYAQLEALKSRYDTTAQVEKSMSAKTVSEQRQAILSAAVDDYPGLGDNTSEHWQLARDLALAAQNPNHRHHDQSVSVNAPRFFADEAARTLKIAPRVKGSSIVSPSVPSQTQTPQAKPVQPAPGHRQTNPPPPAQSVEDKIALAEAQAEAATTGAPMKLNNGLRVLIR